MLRFLLIKNNILLLILLLVSFPSRGGVNEDWERARKANTAQAIATFLENHPGSRFSKDAEAALQRARYDLATRSSDARALEAYIKIYPTGEDAERVKVLLQALHPVQKDGLASEPTPIQATKPVIAINISEMSPWWIAAALLTAIIGYVIIRRLSHGSDKFSTTQTPIAESSSITIWAIPAPQQPSLGNANTAQAAILRDKLDLPPEFDSKMSYREMFQSLSRDRLLEMCAELPVEALDLDNPGRAPTARKMGRAITQVFAVGTYMATKDVPREYGDILFPRMVSKIQSYNGPTLHLELCDLIRDFAIHLGTSGRHADAVRVMRTLKASLFWKTWQQGNFCLFASLNNIAQETKLAVDFEAALVAAQGLPTDQFQQVEAVVKKLQQDMPKAQGQDAQPTDRPTYKVLAVSDQHDIRKWPILNSPNKAVNPPGERATREAGDVQPPANATPIPPSEVKLASNAEMHARQLIFR